MWLLQKNLPAIVVVVVYAKQIMALGRREKKKKITQRSSHSFHPLIINAKGDGLETPWPVIFFFFFFFFVFALTFHAPCLPQPFKSYLPLSAGLHVKRVLPCASTAVLRGGRTSCGLRSAVLW